jgi:hypothetical protein
MRVPWRPDFPDAYVQQAWNSPNGCFKDHADWPAAKTEGDEEAALRIVRRAMREEVLEGILEDCAADGERPPLVVAPALTLAERRNALAIAYGTELAFEMGWEYSDRIFQVRTISRDLRKTWFRLKNQPQFCGFVEAGRRYVLTDDVLTMGGTMASLRGFIENQGGVVICMTALAGGNAGGRTRISLAPQTLLSLTDAHGGRLRDLVRKEMGFGIDCLTEPEGQFLLARPSYDACRKGLHGA